MLSIGLTGGIGSGKSTVARILEVLHIPVYYADLAAKRLMNQDLALQQQIAAEFGKEVFRAGFPDTKALGALVFNDESKLKKLNALVHPVTIRDAEEWLKQQHAPYAVKEAAVLFESGSNKNLDYVIGVDSPLELRIERAMKRDGFTREQVLNRLNKQMAEDKKMALCDFILVNDEQQLLLPQVLDLHKKLLHLSAAA